MRTALSSTAALLLVAVLAQPAGAQQTKPAAQPAAAPAAKGVRAEILRNIDAARDKLIQLAEATPADKFTWRPNDKVRTLGEVYAHVAGGNYYIPTLWGMKPPEGVDPRTFEKDGGDKAKTIDSMKKSFAYVHQVIESASEADLDKPVKLFDHEGTVREGYMIIATHAHEHLGQSIAYARSVNITPPWSAGGQ
jgi:uncharacterized damage-inducible protein DinB